jgi:hypothetical protein
MVGERFLDVVAVSGFATPFFVGPFLVVQASGFGVFVYGPRVLDFENVVFPFELHDREMLTSIVAFLCHRIVLSVSLASQVFLGVCELPEAPVIRVELGPPLLSFPSFLSFLSFSVVHWCPGWTPDH